MVTQTPWIERTFTYLNPVGILPCTIERLRGTPARITELVAGIDDALLTLRPAPDTWSVKDHIGHLRDLEEIHEGRIDDFLARKPVLRPADMLNRKTTQGAHNEKTLEELLEGLRAVRSRFIGRLEQVTEEEAGIVSLHPRLQIPMRVADMAQFAADHDDHHLAVIVRLLRNSDRQLPRA